jgi:hypothetical protein
MTVLDPHPASIPARRAFRSRFGPWNGGAVRPGRSDEKPETPESRILPATGSSNDYLRDTDPGLLQAGQIIGEFNTWSAERLPELYAAGYVGGPTTTCG